MQYKHIVFVFFLVPFFAFLTTHCYKKPVKRQIPENGAELYLIYCARCHQIDGKGLPGTYPPVYASDYLMADKERSIRILIYGQEGEIVVNGETYQGSMKEPDLPKMTDEEIAGILTYVRNNLGNSGSPVSVDEVAKVRKKYAPDLKN